MRPVGTFPSSRAHVPVRGTSPTGNAAANRRALARMSELEKLTGLTEFELARFHREQRERVKARYGMAA